MHIYKRFLRPLRIASLVLISCLMMQVPLWAAGEDSQDQTFKELDDLFRNARLDLKAPSLLYGVVAKGELAYSGRFGQAMLSGESEPTDQTAFRIASMTKMMTVSILAWKIPP